MSNAQNILQALQQTVMGSSTETIKNAEALLRGYEANSNFVEDIGMILEQNKVDSTYLNYKVIMQKSGAVYLNKHANNVVKTRNQQLINMTAQKILKLLTSYKINICHKVHITKALQYMISADKAKIIRAAFEPNLLTLLVQAQQQTDESINFEYLVFLGQTLMNNPGFSEDVFKFILKSFLPFVKLTIRVETLLKQVLEAKNGQLVGKLQNICYLRLFLAKEYFYLLKVYMKRFMLVDIESNKLLYSPDLETAVSMGLQLTLPQNLLSHPLLYLGSIPTTESKSINELKSHCISLLTIIIRTLATNIKEPKLLDINPLFKKSSVYLQSFIIGSQELMKNHLYYNIKDLSVLNGLDEVYAFFIAALRTNCFYGVFVQYKEKMIEDLIFRALVFTPSDYENYYQDPEQFINSLIHIIEKDVKIKFRRDEDQTENDIQSFATLRTFAAEFLNTFCKYQDGTLTEIMNYAKHIILRTVNSEFTPSLMLFVMTILRDASKERKDIHLLINQVLNKMLSEMEIPKRSTQEHQSNSHQNKQLDVQYSLALLLLSKAFSFVQAINPKMIEFSFKLCIKILNNPKVQEVLKLLAINIIEVINHLEEGQPYSPQVLKTFNSLLKSNENPSHHLLQAYFSLIKYNDVILKTQCFKQLVETINTLALLINNQIQRLQKSEQKEQITINKLWNVIRQVGQNPEFIPLMIEPIQNAIMPLLSYIDCNLQVDFEEDILMLMSAFISKSHQVTQNQLKIFEIIPKIFYKQYKAIFGHSYQTLQTFIYYGKEILKTSPAAIRSIIHMCLTSISTKQFNGRALMESDNCEGAMLLQSLIAACGLVIEVQEYEQIVETIRKRLAQKIKFNLLRANLVALLALTLIHSCDKFSNEVNDIILSSILNDISCFQKVKHAPKILIISLNKLLLKYQLQFVTRRYTQILDTIITLLQMISMKKDNFFEEDDDDEERDYANSLIQTVNDIMKIDEFEDFKNQIKVLKEQNLGLIQATVNGLPQIKKDFLKNVLAVERVSNQPRKIFSIKRNK